MISNKLSIFYAFVAACLFGASAPLAKLLLNDIQPVVLASFLYLGSGFGLLFYKLFLVIAQNKSNQEAPLSKTDLPWLLGAIISGGIAAPIVLMFSLKHTPAATASLLLNFEGVVTALIAAAAFHEAISKRIWAAVAFVTVAIVLLSLDPSGKWGVSPGALGVLCACALWGADNNFTRNISAKDPVVIVIVKGIVAGSVSLILALILGNTFPGGIHILLACILGLFCYGLSIVFFILSLRTLGTARTSAYFASAPFIGAALSVVIFREIPNTLFVISLLLFMIGAFLLFAEKHSHAHTHFKFEHDHIHDHCDEHHDHIHPAGSANNKHSHSHRHDRATHEHRHTPDIHHRHKHVK